MGLHTVVVAWRANTGDIARATPPMIVVNFMTAISCVISDGMRTFNDFVPLLIITFAITHRINHLESL